MIQGIIKLKRLLNALLKFTRCEKILLDCCEVENPRFAGHAPQEELFSPKLMAWSLSKLLPRAGFTLIEVLIAISIVGILSTIAVPNILTEVPKFRLNGAARQVLGDLMTARMKAVSHNKRVKIFFVSGSPYKICDDANHNGTVDDCEGDAKTIELQSNYPGVTISSGNNPVFSPRGTSSPGSISITNSSGTKTITIAITGRVKIN